MSVKLDLPAIIQGDHYAHTLRFWTDRAKTTRRDLSGRTYRASLRHGRGTDVTPFTIDDTNAVTGLIVLRLLPDLTRALVRGLAEWDLEQEAAGTITTLFMGRVPIKGDVTL